ncbi:MAG: TonB C-terminal domain-containing protein [Gammaproteobacteria bacterium]|nr:TonB C-terminal domain-containing protein [Gammaproteobacteria bacterium]
MQARSQRLLPWVYSVLLHAAFLVLMILSFHWTNSTLPSLGGTAQVAQPVQATVVDQKLINQQMALLKAQEEQKQEARQKLEAQAQAAKTEREQEEQKVAQLQQQQAAAQKALNAKLAELQQQAQAEKTQQDRIAKLKAEAATAAKKRQNAQRQAELQREIAVEQGALNARRASLMQQWTALVRQKVQSNWNEPANAPADLSCKVQVEQVPGGTVANAQIISCNGNEAIQQSVITAVLRSSPLPPPPEPSLFQRVFVLNFTPQNSPGN